MKNWTWDGYDKLPSPSSGGSLIAYITLDKNTARDLDILGDGIQVKLVINVTPAKDDGLYAIYELTKIEFLRDSKVIYTTSNWNK